MSAQSDCDVLIACLQELLREQEREMTGRIRELEKEAETSAALSQRVSRALVSRLVAKDNALRAIKVHLSFVSFLDWHIQPSSGAFCNSPLTLTSKWLLDVKYLIRWWPSSQLSFFKALGSLWMGDSGQTKLVSNYIYIAIKFQNNENDTSNSGNNDSTGNSITTRTRTK